MSLTKQATSGNTICTTTLTTLTQLHENTPHRTRQTQHLAAGAHAASYVHHARHVRARMLTHAHARLARVCKCTVRDPSTGSVTRLWFRTLLAFLSILPHLKLPTRDGVSGNIKTERSAVKQRDSCLVSNRSCLCLGHPFANVRGNQALVSLLVLWVVVPVRRWDS